MKRLVSLTAKKGRSNLFVAAFEDGETREYLADTLLKFHFTSGTEIDEQVLEEAEGFNQQLLAREAAWRLINHRPRTQLELIRALRKKKFPESLCRSIVDDFTKKNYVNDDRFAKTFATERKRKLEGPMKIRWELSSRGIERETAEREAELTHDDALASAVALLQKWNKRTKPEDQRKRAAAAARFLAGKGHTPDICWEAVRKVLREYDDA